MLQVTSGLSGLPVSFISGVRSGVPDFVKLVAKILGLKDRLRCRGCGRKGRAVARSSGGIRRLSRAPGLRCAHPGKGAAPVGGHLDAALHLRSGRPVIIEPVAILATGSQ